MFDELTRKYVNRDLSWVEFNRRVLQEAQDPETPLLERLKFLGIVANNLDEFMAVRVAETIEKVKAEFTQKDFSGYTPLELYQQLVQRIKSMIKEQYETYRIIVKQLRKQGIVFQSYNDLNATQQKSMEQYYHNFIFPVLTPMAVDQSRPFPLVHAKFIYMSVLLRKKDCDDDEKTYFAIVQVPSNMPRIISVPNQNSNKNIKTFIFMEELIKYHIHTLFTGYVPIAVNTFRLTRNADLTINEEDAEDLLEEIEKEIRRRKRGNPVRLEVQKGIHSEALKELQDEFQINDNVYEIVGPLDLSFLISFVSSLEGFSHLKYPPIQPVYPQEFYSNENHFEVMRKKDVLICHPYESFDAVTDFVMKAAVDPKVMAIKMTLYRVNGDSLLIPALVHATESGKQVTVVVELKARFDEERNIAWAKKLEKAGCHVVYGLVGLKTHAKIILVVRREQQGLRRYVHIGTGNYNASTAKVYTDVGLFTSNPIIGEDASELFNEITGFSGPKNLKALKIAPSGLKDHLFQMIRREAEHARTGGKARIIAKINSLSNKETIDLLYEASKAGVQIDLIVRGVCCLRPGIKGLSENIRVISIVDRFLEHSRIFYFENNGDQEVYLSSADWMSRNLKRRVELLCPVFDPKLQNMLINMLKIMLKDNVKARELQQNGDYVFIKSKEEPPLRSQLELMKITTWKPQEQTY